MGTPSLRPDIKPSSPKIMDSRFGSGRLDSGPAILCNTSWLDLLLTLTVVADPEEPLGATKEEGGVDMDKDMDAEWVWKFEEL